MATTTQRNLQAAQWRSNGHTDGAPGSPAGLPFGENTFSPAEMRKRLPKNVWRRLESTLDLGEPLDNSSADSVASAMREWALERGATHYTHWFQPLTGSTAEKHDSFYEPVGDGTAITEFSGKELIRGEPDASSFPTGGIRDTFEARGYTAWDPSSPAFLLENPKGAVLCIPTAFVSWTGEALDMKTPLLRSMEALSASAIRLLRLLGDAESERVFTTIGAEQEYFLIDEQFYYARPDLMTCNRTLFGAKPAKGHELDDHYFGSIPPRVLSCMLEVETELAKLGVPIKTRHNEVAPGQYEVAPIFENSNVGVDHQQLTMMMLQQVARRYGLVCLLHEKPFAGVNGSGKHNNWSMGTNAGENLLDPGDSAGKNLKFLLFATAVMQAVNRHQGLLRASVASPGQDHRLGANEAPPAIMSIFLGAELRQVFDTIEAGEALEVTTEQVMKLGSPMLPDLPMDNGDRNRTSPFAFTGNKFEFRALGANDSPSWPNTVLNTIVAEALDELTDQLETAVEGGTALEEAVPPVLQRSYAANKQIVFNGDNYTDEWEKEAEQRGLLNLRQTPDALPMITTPGTVETFSTYKVLSERELEARLEVYFEHYIIQLNIEGETAARIARTMLLPAALRHLALLHAAGGGDAIARLSGAVSETIEEFVYAIETLESVNDTHPEGADPAAGARYMSDTVIPAMEGVREVADRLEHLVAADLWPLPSYSEMLFVK